MALTLCPECQNKVSGEAEVCPSCGHPIKPRPLWKPGVAALLSLIIPGAGQLYKGKVLAGLLWFVFVIGGYFLFIVPGLILHLICIIAAASGDPYKK